MRTLELARRRDDSTELSGLARLAESLTRQGFFQYSAIDAWRPAVNLYESADSYFVCVDLAGLDRDKINVTENQGVLVISGTREHPRPPDSCERSIHLMEIDQGPFCRSVEIPSEVDMQRINARYERGFLWVELPKRRQP